MFVAVAAALLDEHDLVDPGLFVAREMFAQLRRRADAAAPGIIRQLVLGLQKALPQIGATGLMLTKQRVIAERIAKKLEAIEAAADRFGLSGWHDMPVTIAMFGLTRCPIGTHSSDLMIA
jgi:hypothetical protein